MVMWGDRCAGQVERWGDRCAEQAERWDDRCAEKAERWDERWPAVNVYGTAGCTVSDNTAAHCDSVAIAL